MGTRRAAGYNHIKVAVSPQWQAHVKWRRAATQAPFPGTPYIAIMFSLLPSVHVSSTGIVLVSGSNVMTGCNQSSPYLSPRSSPAGLIV